MSEEVVDVPNADEQEEDQGETTDADTSNEGNVTAIENPPPEDTPERKSVISEAISGEDLTKEQLDIIIEKTLYILDMSQRKVDEQKIDSHSMTFMLLRIKESLDAYMNDYIPKLNAYLFHAEKMTADYYEYIVKEHINYCTDRKDIEKKNSETIECGSGNKMPKHDILTVMKTVTDNYYASGKSLKAGRHVLKDIYSTMKDRTDIVNKIARPMPTWLELQDSVNSQLEEIRQQTFKISAYVDFLKQGETKMSPTLDLTSLEKPKEKTKEKLKEKPKEAPKEPTKEALKEAPKDPPEQPPEETEKKIYQPSTDYNGDVPVGWEQPDDQTDE